MTLPFRRKSGRKIAHINNTEATETNMKQQVFSSGEVQFGKADNPLSWSWSGDNSKIPVGSVLEIGTITLNYFPKDGGTLGRADVVGRDAAGKAVWRVQATYVEPKKTRHLTFPIGLRLEAGGKVHIGFTSEGPGTILVDINGILLHH
jgi:hypothetical protein